MTRAAKKSSTNAITTHTPCPVVELSQKLLVLWDADDSSQREYYAMGGTASQLIREETMNQFSEWRNAIEKIISYTQAKGLEGALVQMALALDTLDDLLPMLKRVMS